MTKKEMNGTDIIDAMQYARVNIMNKILLYDVFRLMRCERLR